MNIGTKPYNNVVNYFGKEILLPDRNINRELLGQKVFQDSNARKRINKATHSYIFYNIMKTICYYWFRNTFLFKKVIVIIDGKLHFFFHFFYIKII